MVFGEYILAPLLKYRFYRWTVLNNITDKVIRRQGADGRYRYVGSRNNGMGGEAADCFMKENSRADLPFPFRELHPQLLATG
jgi:hypothetical protein